MICIIHVLLISFFKCIVPENIPTPPTKGFLFEHLPPLWIEITVFQFCFIICLLVETPPPGISSKPAFWCGYGYFLQLHNDYIDLEIMYIISVGSFKLL